MNFLHFFFFFFKQKTAYEITEGDWSSDVCSSDLRHRAIAGRDGHCSRAGSSIAISSRWCRCLRSEERRVGKECPQVCRYRWSSDLKKKKKEKDEKKGGGGAEEYGDMIRGTL